ncbi:hypothetical protein A3A60_01865 [Candidatus Curtissbacteria bacterium RIFCSPLOWO2_01_FULL_42_26]|uniref:YqgF/RNase H-like domain-containing protein n=1 Tax=Candidatus Curtissbacteria bacterium RIFCSPLOWO2_01_FULL_42_26 TaxID=1797729 RepID=A0A1F5I1Y7_9BACT|nr:MAG: hypothetical protein A3A60_01865 [Candidatus Curtissbacteria bacterium RIFCSPLOWO2_01_FULL_42_26]
MLLGIDLGQKTTGVAVSEGLLASPYTTIKHKSINEAVTKVNQICKEINADTVVLGVVEGKIRSLFEKFAKLLKIQNSQLKIIFWDETLTSRQARASMIKLQVPKKKRGAKEHEMAASFILQSYLDSK